MNKELVPKEALKAFLESSCEIKYVTASGASEKNKNYIFYTRDCVLFMAEAYVQGMRNSIGQTQATMQEARKSGNFLIYSWRITGPPRNLVWI